MVLLPPETGNVQIADRVLGIGIAVLGGAHIPPRRLGETALDSEAVMIQKPQIVLGQGIPALGERCPDPVGGGVIAALVGGITVIRLAPYRRRQDEGKPECEACAKDPATKPPGQCIPGVMPGSAPGMMRLAGNPHGLEGPLNAHYF